MVVTLDDGFESVYTNACPVLRELNVPATVFLNTAYLGSPEPFPFDPWAIANQRQAPLDSFRALSVDQCHELIDGELIELGAHTHTHQDFRNRTDAFRSDLETNVEFLQREFCLNDVTFAFPFGKPCLGYVNPELVEAARQVGVCCALTTEDKLVDPTADPFTWGRFNVYDFDTPGTLAGKLKGWYSWAPRMQELFERKGVS